MPDRRPHGMLADEAVQVIANDHLLVLKASLDATFEQIAALDGEPEARRNDALSATAALCAFAITQLVGYLMVTKRWSLDQAAPVAIRDVMDRTDRELATIFARYRPH